MSTTVENRVVKMTFDNTQFEKAIRTTLQSLKTFEEKLKLNGATAGMDAVGKAADRLNLSTLSDKAKAAVDKMKSHFSEASDSISKVDDAADNVDFSALSNAAQDAIGDINKATSDTDFSPASNAAQDAVADINNAAEQTDLSPIVDSANDAGQAFEILKTIALGSLLDIGGRINQIAIDGGKQLVDGLFGPIKDGMKEYETQMGSIQTIMANAGLNFSSDEDIARVNENLDELNTYADKTIYNFTEMTRNIGTFTAAGIGLEESTKAIQGIANLAALSGSNSQQASTAMYQLSQALAAGTLKLQDWNSVVNAGMGGQIFQEALKRTARAYGVEVDEIIEANGSFRESLQAGWITSDILTETLNSMAISYQKVGDEAYKAAYKEMRRNGYTKAQAKEILRLAKVAEQSATKVRTWTQMWDTVGEAIGSNWALIWRNFLGDFKQATDTFTFLSNKITMGVDWMLGDIVNAAKEFNASGAIKLIFGSFARDESGEELLDENFNFVRIAGALDYFARAIEKPIAAIRDAFHSVFGVSNEELGLGMVTMALRIRDIAKSLVISDNAATGLRYVFEGLFSVFHVFGQIATDVIGVIFGLIDAVRTFTDPLLDIILLIGGQLGRVLLWAHDKFFALREAFIFAIQPLRELFEIFGMIIKGLFGMSDAADAILLSGDGIIDILEAIWRFIDLPEKIRLIGDALGFVKDAILNLIGWTDAGKSFEYFGKAFTKATEGADTQLGVFLKRFEKNPIVNFFKNVKESVKSAYDIVMDFINNFAKADEEAENSEVPSLLDRIKEGMNAIGGPLVGFFGSIRDFFVSIKDIFGSLLGGVPSFASSFFGVFVEQVKSAKDAAGGLSGFIMQIASAVGGFFISALQNASTILSGLSGILSGIAEHLRGFLSSVLPMLGAILGTIAKVLIYITFRVLSKLGEVLLFLLVWVVIPLTKAIGEFIGKVKDWFMALTPVVKITEILTNFKDKVVDTFTNLSTAIEFNKNTGGIVADIANAFENLKNSVLGLPEFFSNLTPEKVIGGLLGIRDKIVDFFKYISTLNPQKLATDLGNALKNTANNIGRGVMSVFNLLNNVMGDNDFGITLFGMKINRKIHELVDSITKTFRNFASQSQNIPDLFFNIFKSIKKRVESGINTVKDAITNFEFKPSDILSIFNNITASIHKFLEEWFPEILTEFEGFTRTISDTLVGLFNGQVSWSELFSQWLGNAQTVLTNVGGAIVAALLWLKDQIGGIAGTLFDKLTTMDNPVGNFFKQLKDRFEQNNKDLKKQTDTTSATVGGMSEDVGNDFDDIATKLADFWANFDFKKIPEYGFGVLSDILSFLKDKAQPIIDFVKGIPSDFGQLFKDFLGLFDPKLASDLVKFAKDIVAVKIMWESAGLIKGVTRLTNAFAKQLGGDKKSKLESATTNMLKLATALAALAVALYVISLIPDPWKSVQVLGAVGVIVVAMTFVAGLLEKFLPHGGDNVLKAAASLGVLALSIVAMLGAIVVLNNFDFEANAKGIGALIAFMAVFAIFTRALGNGGENSVKAAASLLIFALTIRYVLLPTIQALTEMVNNLDEKQMDNTISMLVMLAVIIVAMGYAIGKVAESKHPILAAASLLIFAGAITLISDAVEQLAKQPFDSVKTSILLLGLLIAEFAGIAWRVKPSELIATAAAMLIFSAAIVVMSYGLKELAKNNWEDIASAGGAIVALMAALGIMAAMTKTSDVIGTAAGLLIFSASIGILALSLKTVTELDQNALASAANSLAMLLGIFAALVVILSIPVLAQGAATVLPLLSLAFISLGAAAIMIAYALNLAVDAIARLALFGPVLTSFVMLISANVWSFVAAAAGLAALGAAFMIFGPGAMLAGGGLLLLSMGIREFLVLIADLPMLLDNAGQSMGLMLETIATKPGEIWSQITTWFWETLIPELTGFFANIWTTIQEAIAPLATWFMENIWPVLTDIVTKLSDWATNTAIPWLMEHKDEIFAKLGELAQGLWNWIQTSLLPFLAKVASDFGAWMQSDGIPMLLELKDKVLAKLGELKDKLIEWARTDGVQMAQNAMNTIMEKAGEFKDKLVEWAQQIPGWLMNDALPWIAGKLNEAGDFIVQGIADGILAGYNWITNAISNLGDWAVQGIKDFFGIASPSKLMRDEVGRYLPMGVADGMVRYASVTEVAAKKMGEVTLDSISSVFDKADFSTFNPSITPVVDASSFNSEMGSYDRMLRSIMSDPTVNATSSNVVNSSLSESLAGKVDANMQEVGSANASLSEIKQLLAMNQAVLEETYSQNQKLFSGITATADDIARNVRDGKNLYMDSGQLVGAITPAIDASLGSRISLARRGVF